LPNRSTHGLIVRKKQKIKEKRRQNFKVSVKPDITRIKQAAESFNIILAKNIEKQTKMFKSLQEATARSL